MSIIKREGDILYKINRDRNGTFNGRGKIIGIFRRPTVVAPNTPKARGFEKGPDGELIDSRLRLPLTSRDLFND